MDFPQHENQAELSRLLVAADEGIDPHGLVGICCGLTILGSAHHAAGHASWLRRLLSQLHWSHPGEPAG